MKDEDLVKLVNEIGYTEGMPVVANPGILDPNDFVREVLEVRLPNPYIPDTPQRIATDTSQKLAIRYGVMSIPTVIFFKDGKEIDRKVGVMPPQAFTGVLDANL